MRDAELLADERLDQRVLRREVAVHRADPDLRAARDVVHLHAGAVLGARDPRRLQDALAVAPRVGAERAFLGCAVRWPWRRCADEKYG